MEVKGKPSQAADSESQVSSQQSAHGSHQQPCYHLNQGPPKPTILMGALVWVCGCMGVCE